jgi:hypothetical protein
MKHFEGSDSYIRDSFESAIEKVSKFTWYSVCCKTLSACYNSISGLRVRCASFCFNQCLLGHQNLQFNTQTLQCVRPASGFSQTLVLNN